ncbi:hypothetical protein ACJX0J_016723, partial [Zea mays]
SGLLDLRWKLMHMGAKEMVASSLLFSCLLYWLDLEGIFMGHPLFTHFISDPCHANGIGSLKPGIAEQGELLIVDRDSSSWRRFVSNCNKLMKESHLFMTSLAYAQFKLWKTCGA